MISRHNNTQSILCLQSLPADTILCIHILSNWHSLYYRLQSNIHQDHFTFILSSNKKRYEPTTVDELYPHESSVMIHVYANYISELK